MDETSHKQHTTTETETEAEFLSRQANEAKAALKACSAETAHKALRALDPRPLFRNRPMAAAAIAGAAVVGLGATIALTRRRKKPDMICLPKDAAVITLETAKKKKDKPGIMGRLGSHVFAVARESLMSALVAKGVAGRSGSQEQQQEQFLGAGI